MFLISFIVLLVVAKIRMQQNRYGTKNIIRLTSGLILFTDYDPVNKNKKNDCPVIHNLIDSKMTKFS